MSQKAVLVGVELPKDVQFSYSMEELKNVAQACGFEVIATFSQKADRFHKATYIGKGKLEEVCNFIEEYPVDAIIMNDELSPSQIRNIEEIVVCDLLDRTMLILDIFASRAKTKEAMLQVEISRLQYQLPRLIGTYAALDRQKGGSFSNRGGGEKKLEIDQRRIEKQIHRKQSELRKMVVDRKTQRIQRSKNKIPTIALVGYTNAGKSTLLNAFVGNEDKQVFAKDMLFATLETRARRMFLSHHNECVIIDTVGFIDKLPHALVKAFRSTLEEVMEADLLIHVIDISHPNYRDQKEITMKTLHEIGVVDIPIIEVYNKVDAVLVESTQYDEKIYISALENKGLDFVKAKIESILYKDYVEGTLFIPYQSMDILYQMIREGVVVNQTQEEEGFLVDVWMDQSYYDSFIKFKVE